MKPQHRGSLLVILTLLMILFRQVPVSGQTTLLTETFENGGFIPAGWATEIISPNNVVTFVSSSTYPSGFTAFNGTWMTKFNSYDANGGVVRLKRTIPVSTINYSSVGVDFAWLESTGYAGSNDKVEVEWSTNGTTWTSAGTFLRYNAVQGWKLKSIGLGSGAANQPALYIAFRFTSDFGNNCFLDLVHLTGIGPPVPVTVTFGTGTTPCSYPYTTGFMDARTQMLFTTSDIYGAGGSAGQIQQIGFDIGTAAPTAMTGFTIKMRNTSYGTIPSWITDSMTVCYSGTYSVAGTGWQMITLQTPFSYDGRNLLVEICFDNSSTGTSSQVYGSSAAGKIYHHYLNDPVGGGCATTLNTPQTVRPNLRIFEQQYVGTLTGLITNCYNWNPLTGVTVTCGPFMATTNPSGVFTLFNVPAGTWTVTYSLAGFLPQTCQAIILPNHTTVSPCGCMSPMPAYFTGIITNMVTGDPIPGVKVQVGQTFTYSLANGYYNLAIYPCGSFPAVFSKAGFNTYTIVTTFICGNTTTQNVQMVPVINPPQNVTALTDTVIGQTDIAWTPPATAYEIIYDDGTQEQCISWMMSENLNAVKFTPAAYPAVLYGTELNLCNPAPPGNLPYVPFQIYIFDDSGPGGCPGNVIAGPYDIMSTTLGWSSWVFPTTDTITTGSFFIAMAQGGNYPNCLGLGLDTTTNGMRSWQKDVYNAGPWVPVQGNFMIRAMMNGAEGVLPPSMTSYKISRLKHGEENTPAVWTTLGTVTGTTSYTDYAWPSLPCGPYRWAVQTFIGAGNPSPASFSNIVYKCWTADVTIYSEKCCPEMTGSINIRLQSADTVIWATTDTTGHAYFQDIPYDTYQVWIGIFSCELYDELITISSDTAFDAILGGGTAYPPTGLSVNCHTLVATWNPPMAQVYLFSETWASGNFTANNWTLSGGVNWMISNNFGNPAPSAAFNWTPQVTNYNQYLTSKSVTGVNAPQTKLSYDIFLSSFATTYLNAMAVELWDGTSWDILKVYDNMNGNIPWTSETLPLPVTGNDNFKIRFHAYGTDSYDLNNWNIDNIRIVASENVYGWGYDPYCMLGYNFYLNSVLSAFTTDTAYNIPPDQVQYGQTYTACVEAVYGYNTPSYSVPVCKQFTSCFLYAPTNFAVQPLECSAWLTWEKPQELGGGDPPGLIGYYIYREYVLHDSVMSPDILEYYDLGLEPGHYHYDITAVYDLSSYGFPGQRDESLNTGTIYVDIVCGDNLPFLENWDNGTFTYSDWTFEPSQGNWDVTSATGNPSPTADFSGLGLKSNGPYDYAMISKAMDASQWTCSNVWLDFDIKLIDFASNSTEHMAVEVLYDNTWHQVADYVNNGSFGFETQHISINDVRGKGLKVRFRAHGDDPYNILHWYIDNINVYGVCLPATGLTWSATADQVDLSWEAPCPEVNGYNVYRTDSSGNIPYYKLNTDLVAGTTFTDLPSYWTPDAVYRYYVTAVTMDEYTSGVLCESGSSDTILASYPVAVPGLDPSAVEVFPNPAQHMITVKSEVPILEIGMISYLGKPVFLLECGQSLVERIRITGFADGVYFLKITTDKGLIVKKVIVEK